MQTAYNILIVLSVIVAVVFILLIMVTGKGDAMSGGGGVRTSFKGRATIEDMISRMTLGLGIGFMVVMIALDLLGAALTKK
ncbi:MAG: preprotein translocase subunit SecG [Fimbriimonadaceae bacterium]|jgi:preprotein translocase subunit SecG